MNRPRPPRGACSDAVRATRRPRVFARRATAALVAWTLAASLVPEAGAAPAGRVPADAALERALRTRTVILLERRERARADGGVPLPALQRDLVALADSLETHGLDSLAAIVRYRAAGVLTRLARSREAGEQARLSAAAARRVRWTERELGSLAYLAESQALDDPVAALAMIRRLAPRLAATRDAREIAGAYSTEARAWMALGRARESLAAARKAVKHFRQAGAFRQEAHSLSQCSQALRFQRRHAEALVIADSIIALGRRRDIGRSLANGLLERASCLRTLGRVDEGLRAVEEAMAVDRRFGDALHLSNGRRFKSSLLLEARRYRECVLTADTLLADRAGDRDPTLALAAATFRTAAELGLGRMQRAETLLVARIEAYERFRRALPDDEARASTSRFAGAAYAVAARALIAQDRPEDAWRIAERGRAFALKTLLGAGEPDLAGLLAYLDRTGAALLQFDSLDPELGNVFVLAAGRVTALPLRHGVKRNDVEQVRDRFASRSGPRTGDPGLVRLGQALLGEVLPRVPAGVTRLVIVPPNDLPDLPLEALPVPFGSGVARLGDRWTVSYAPAASVLPGLAARPTRNGPFVAVAAPAVDARDAVFSKLDARTRGRIAQSLPHARAEARRLGDAGALALTGAGATLERLRAATPASALHFATHALEDARLAPLGALVLAGATPLLTPAAIESLGVSADLVSLGACRTLGSTSYTGEGAFGLARAFLAAGARTVVTTRWAVGDRAAARAMELFYGGLRAGLGRDESLARAGRQLEREGFPPRDRWAFMVLGDGHPSLPGALAAGRRDHGPGRSPGQAK